MKTSHFLPDKMFGAVVGDTVGSVYEWHNIKYKIDEESMAVGRARFTDDSVMTCAVADGILRALRHGWQPEKNPAQSSKARSCVP